MLYFNRATRFHSKNTAFLTLFSYFLYMRILTLTKFYHPYRGGIETVSKNITDENLKAGHQSDVLCANDSCKSEVCVVDGAHVFRSPRLAYLKSTSICPLMPWQLKSLVQSYDLLHVHFPDPMTALSLYLVKPETPFVIHWHSDIIKQKTLKTFFQPLQDWCLSTAKKIIVTSEEYAKHSMDLKPYLNKVVVAPIGIEEKENIRHRVNPTKKILAVGRLTYYKGFEVLIEASKLLPSDYEVTIVGDGELKKSLEDKIKAMGLEDKVRLTGKLTDDELKNQYERNDIFCLPSTHKSEAFGVVLVEAMSYSLPIVTCNIEGSGVPWVNEHGVTGLNVPVNSPQDLADALQSVLSDSKTYSKMSQESFKRFKKHFTINEMTKRVWSSYSV